MHLESSFKNLVILLFGIEAPKEKLKFVLQFILCEGGPSCCNMNLTLWRQLWPEWGWGRLSRGSQQVFTYRRNVHSQRVPEQITTIVAFNICKVLIYHHLWLWGGINKPPRHLLCKLQVIFFLWVLYANLWLRRKSDAITQWTHETYLGVRSPSSIAPSVIQQLTGASRWRMASRFVWMHAWLKICWPWHWPRRSSHSRDRRTNCASSIPENVWFTHNIHRDTFEPGGRLVQVFKRGIRVQ